jgi:hypothetical protein
LPQENEGQTEKSFKKSVSGSVPDPDPILNPDTDLLYSDPIVRGMDQAPFIILLSSSKNSKKNLDSFIYFFRTCLGKIMSM